MWYLFYVSTRTPPSVEIASSSLPIYTLRIPCGGGEFILIAVRSVCVIQARARIIGGVDGRLPSGEPEEIAWKFTGIHPWPFVRRKVEDAAQ